MISKTMQAAINDQIKHEFYSSFLYLSMSAYFETINLPGCAHWMRAQSQEEQEHALKFFDFLNDRGGSVELQALDQPPSEFQSPLDAFQQALDHERKVTSLIHRLYELALKEGDYATQAHLQWFITEQVEEEKNASQIIEQIKMTGGQASALFMLDRQLAARS
ncbi:MAG TPA: ferritin [Roseiflexaceae bacterium]